jgi:rhodanese-related sulfurtransferase
MTTETGTADTAPTSANPVLRVPPAAPADAAAHFAASLAFHTDVSDVAAALAAAARTGTGPGFVLLDTRGPQAWEQGRIPGAVHLPTDRVPQLAASLLDRRVPIVVHCWGPACNGAARAAYALASRGYQVKEMLGGIEYWIREGLPYETPAGPTHRAPDPLTAPPAPAACGC